MRNVTFAAVLAVAVLGAGPAAAAPKPVVPWIPQVLEACNQFAPGSCAVSPVTRRPLTPEIVEYSFTLKVGPGQHDVIGLHRIVNETVSIRPVNDGSGIFLVHGDAWGFDAAFLASAASAAAPDTRNLPFFLADKGVDVWGIDLRWALVPAGTTDFSFMQSWGLAQDASDVGIGLAVASKVRGAGSQKLHLLGWSRGGQISYAYMNTEASLAPAQQRVKGFIPTDIYIKTDVPAYVQGACDRLLQRQQQLANGVYADNTGQLFSLIGFLAVNDPASPSAFYPGDTNLQTGLRAGSRLFDFIPPGQAPVPEYHLTGGVFDGANRPTGLTFTEDALLLDQLALTAPFEPTRLFLDAESIMCGLPNLPFIDDLANVTVPVLYIGADGGFGASGLHSLSLLGSTDKEALIVDLTPDQLHDFGHSDLFLAIDAQQLVWQPLLDWIRGARKQ